MNCHGGNGSAADKDAAHEGMTAHPLEDIYTDCHSCHPAYELRASRFAATLGVTPRSCATSTPPPAANSQGGASSLVPGASTRPGKIAAWMAPVGVAGASLAMLVLFCVSLAWLESHRAVN